MTNTINYYAINDTNGVGFLHGDIHDIPDNAIPLTDDQYNDLIEKAYQGLDLVIENGQVVAKPHVPTLDEKLMILNRTLKGQQEAGVYYQPKGSDKPVLFASDDNAQSKLTQAFILAKNGLYDDNTSYMLKDGSYVKMNADDIIGLALKEKNYYNANNNHAHELQTALEKDLNTDLNAGWPSNQ